MITVILSEEYGYRTWCWETGMTAVAFAAWWEHLETVRPYFFNPQGTLPGKLTEVPESTAPKGGEWTGHIHCDDDSSLHDDRGNSFFHAGASIWHHDSASRATDPAS